jgi:hypothetical protein
MKHDTFKQRVLFWVVCVNEDARPNRLPRPLSTHITWKAALEADPCDSYVTYNESPERDERQTIHVIPCSHPLWAVYAEEEPGSNHYGDEPIGYSEFPPPDQPEPDWNAIAAERLRVRREIAEARKRK